MGHLRMQGRGSCEALPLLLSHSPLLYTERWGRHGWRDGPRPVSHTTQKHIGPEGAGQLVFPFLAHVHRSVCPAVSGRVIGLEQW